MSSNVSGETRSLLALDPKILPELYRQAKLSNATEDISITFWDWILSNLILKSGYKLSNDSQQPLVRRAVSGSPNLRRVDIVLQAVLTGGVAPIVVIEVKRADKQKASEREALQQVDGACRAYLTRQGNGDEARLAGSSDPAHTRSHKGRAILGVVAHGTSYAIAVYAVDRDPVWLLPDTTGRPRLVDASEPGSYFFVTQIMRFLEAMKAELVEPGVATSLRSREDTGTRMKNLVEAISRVTGEHIMSISQRHQERLNRLDPHHVAYTREQSMFLITNWLEQELASHRNT